MFCRNKIYIPAFNLAEVLLVIGILGIVAVISLPVLISGYQKKVNRVRLKKAYSILSQTYTKISGTDGNPCMANDSECLGLLFAQEMKFIDAQIWQPSITLAQGCWEGLDIKNLGEEHYCATSIDGIVYDFDMENPSSLSNSRTAWIGLDLNGPKPPNKYGIDKYFFEIKDEKILPIKGSCYDGKRGDLWDEGGCTYKYLYKNY